MKNKILNCIALFALIVCACVCISCNGKTNSATISFQTGTEITIPEYSAEVGSKIYPPATPSRQGYRFCGWTLDGEPFTFGTMPEKDITLVAVWNKIYTVTYITGSGATEIAAQEYISGENIIKPENPVRPHYKFIEWQSDGAAFDFSEKITDKDITLTAVWQKAVTLTFNTGVNGLTVAPLTEVAGSEISEPEKPLRQGYYLRNWLLGGVPFEFTVMPEKDVTLTAEWVELTNLPAMFIDLKDANGHDIPIGEVTREQYVNSKISLTNVEKAFELNNVVSEFKGRGNGSWTESGDKKGYKIKFDKKQSLFGREKNKHWVIIACTNFNDTTMNRNKTAYDLSRELFDNIEFTTHTELLDIYVNGNYHGVYLLCEHTRVGEGRVDIVSEYGVDNTGYLIEYDAYAAGTEGIDYFKVPGLKYPFSIHSPDPEDYIEEGISKAVYQKQIKYIADYVTRVYNAALNKNYSQFEELADVNSFADMYILHELFKNADTGYSSFYMYKKPNGKLFAGPPWDFDCSATATRGDNSPQGIYVAGSVQETSSHTASELYISLMQTNGFKRLVSNRWKVLSPSITEFINNRFTEEYYAENKAALAKNFMKWPPAGWPAGFSEQAAAELWVRDVKALKQWLLDRVTYLNRTWA